MILCGRVQIEFKAVLVEEHVQLLQVEVFLALQVFLHGEHIDQITLVGLSLVEPFWHGLQGCAVHQVERYEYS